MLPRPRAFYDWLPTLCHLAGASIPADRAIDGQNVLPALRGEGAGQLPQQRFWQWSRGVPVPTHNAAVRDGDWKLVLPGDELANTMRPLPGWDRDLQLYEDVDMHPEKYHGGVPGPLGRPPCVGIPAEPPLLYNLAADPLETTDLSQQHPEKVSRLKTDFENWFEHVEAERATIVDKPYYSQNSRA
jgi:arylsulfatase A-like enzyme